MNKILIAFFYATATLAFSISGLQQARAQADSAAPLRLAVAGLKHGHAPFIFGRKGKTDVMVVGVYEPDQELASQYAKRYNLNKELFFTDLDQMLEKVKPEALAAYGSIYDHLAAVEACAPKGIHVMVEKPLAPNLSHGLKMEQLALKYKIHLLTNYETSWYPATVI